MSKANLLLPSIVTAEAPFKSMGDFLDAEEQQLALKMGKALSNDSVGKSTERRGSLSNERLASSTSLNSRRMSLQSDRRQSFTGERRQSLVSQVLSKASSRRTSLHDSAASNWQLGESEWPMLDQIATVIPPVLVHDMEESYMDPDNIKKKLTGIISSAYAEIEALDEHVADITTRLRLQESTPHHESMDLLVGSERMLNIPLEQEPEKIEQQVPHFVEEAIFPSINHAKLGRFARDKEALSFIVQAMQSNPFVQHFRLKRHWTDCAKSKKSQSILVYSFWYVWHNFWKSEDKQIMDELSDLISSNYVDLLVKFKGNIKQKEEFFKMYPDLISQALHFAFVDNFPNSRSLLTNDFKNGMYDVIFHLLCGLHPSIMVCEAWSRPNDVNVQGSGSRINKADPVVEIQTPKAESCVIKTVGVPFNIYGNSPMVDKYLSKRNCKREQRKVTMMRRELLHNDTRPSLNYKNIVEESLRNSTHRARSYKHSQQEAIKDSQKLKAEFAKKMEIEEQKQAQIFESKEHVKSLADKLVESHEESV